MISLALNFDHLGPQGAKSKYPSMGRTNPIHTMLRTGTDAYSGVLDKRGIRAADDMVVMPLQCGTQWDGLGHVFYENYMWNGYDCREVTSAGAQKCGIEKTKNKMVGRGVLLDVRALQGRRVARRRLRHHQRGPRRHREEAEGRAQARRLRHRAHRHDGALPEARQAGTAIRAATRRASPSRRWTGSSDTELAALASDTWGCEVRPNESEEGINQPWHWITIPIMGMTMGEIFELKELADDCAADKRLRIPVRRAGDPDHRRGRLAGQSAGDQVSGKGTNT